MTEGEGDEEKSEIQKFEYLENENNFSWLFEYYHLLNKRKIEDTSFKLI